MNTETYAYLYAAVRLIFGISIFFGLLGFVVAFVAQFEAKFLKYKRVGIVLLLNVIFWDFLTFLVTQNYMITLRMRLSPC